MLVSIRILIYALFLLGLVLFGFTIIMFELMKDLDGSEDYRKLERPVYFGNIWRGMTTMFQFCTFADWTEISRSVTEEQGWWCKVLLLFVLALGGVGCLNLVVG